jgi:hypothetical protein
VYTHVARKGKKDYSILPVVKHASPKRKKLEKMSSMRRRDRKSDEIAVGRWRGS